MEFKDVASCYRCSVFLCVWLSVGHNREPYNKKLSYHRGTVRCVMSVEILRINTQQSSTTSPEQIEVMKLED